MGNLKAIKSFGDLETPQVILCRKDYEQIGELYPVEEFRADFPLKDAKEISFKIYKEIDGELNPYWDKIQNLRTVYIPDYDEYYEIGVSEDESNEVFKTITGQGICECELSNLLLSIDINTESDIINNKDYEPTIIYNPDKPSFSLLHRVLKDKAPHYQILHVDDTLAKLQRTFSVSDSNINDFLKNELSTEIDALVVYDSTVRGISLYDLASVCNDCGHRSVFTGECPECGSLNISLGYGEYTNVYISTANLSDNVELTAEKSTIKNCFKVCGGDDTINTYVRTVNPNGSDYISCFSELQYEDMPDLLVQKLKSYKVLCESKRAEYTEIMQNICECIDQYLYYDSGMMPSPETDNTSATEELAKLTAENIGDIGVSNLTTATLTSVNNAITSYIKIFMSAGYEASITSSRYENNKWYGKFKVSSTSYPEEDFAENTSEITLNVSSDYLTYVKQKIDKALATKDLADEVYDYTLYGVKPLEVFESAYDNCLSILIEHGDNVEGAAGYSLYEKYNSLLNEVQKEIVVKEEIRDSWKTKELEYQTQKETIQKKLDLETYLGTALYKVYCTYRRDDKYENQNYISDGLDNAELTDMAYKLVQVAEKELRLACQNQYTLTSSCYNLFAMQEFEPFHDSCDLGNWIHVEVGGQVYCLRLLKISIDYSSADQITVEFSNVTKVHNGVSDLREILSDAQSIASSYPITAKQVADDNKVTNDVRDWIANGLNATNIMIANSPLQNIVIDENGLLGRAYDDITGAYDPCQLRLINSTIALTDDNWKTTKTAFGKYIYQDPVTGEYKYAYGIIGQVLVGRLILGEELGIYSTNGTSMTFTNNGLMIKNDANSFTVNPNSTELLTISNSSGKVFYVDENGMLHISGDGAGLDISANSSVTGLESKLTVTSEGLTARVSAAEGNISTLQQTASGFSVQISEINDSLDEKVDSDKVITAINLDTSGVKIQGDQIDIIGNTTFYTLSGGLADGTTTINGGCIRTGTLDASLITVKNLVVGENVTMGANATITWENVSSKPDDLAYTSDIPDNEYITTITKNTVTTEYVNTLNITAGSVAAENITGTTISGKTISACNMVSTNFDSCAGGFTSIFMYDRTKTGTDEFQYGSICGQYYVSSSDTLKQYEMIRINNSETKSWMLFYGAAYTKNEFAVDPYWGLRLGSTTHNSSPNMLHTYFNKIENEFEDSANTIRLHAARIGFKTFYGTEAPAFEMYDRFTCNNILDDSQNTHSIECKVFGDFRVASNIYYAGEISQSSSIRYKTNIASMDDSTALNLLKYDVVTYDYIDGLSGRHGMIAEDAAEISEYGIVRDSQGRPDSISYVNYIPDIIKLNQIMYKEIEELRQEVKELKGKLEDINE